MDLKWLGLQLVETSHRVKPWDTLRRLPGLPIPPPFYLADRSCLPGWRTVIIFPASFAARCQPVLQICLMRSKGKSDENVWERICSPMLNEVLEKKPCGWKQLFFILGFISFILSLLPVPWVCYHETIVLDTVLLCWPNRTQSKLNHLGNTSVKSKFKAHGIHNQLLTLHCML